MKMYIKRSIKIGKNGKNKILYKHKEDRAGP